MKITNWLTSVVMFVWVASLPVRVMSPGVANVFVGTDAAVLVILGYWFSANAITKRRNGNGASK